jgi:hypothetical protein
MISSRAWEPHSSHRVLNHVSDQRSGHKTNRSSRLLSVTGQIILITDKFSFPLRPHGASYLPSGSIGIPSGKKLLWPLPSLLSGKLPVERSSV